MKLKVLASFCGGFLCGSVGAVVSSHSIGRVTAPAPVRNLTTPANDPLKTADSDGDGIDNHDSHLAKSDLLESAALSNLQTAATRRTNPGEGSCL
jgi:hypothetical protein